MFGRGPRSWAFKKWPVPLCLSQQLSAVANPGLSIFDRISRRLFFQGTGSCNSSQMGGKIAGAGAVKSFCIGIGLFTFSQNFWILYDWNEERKVRKLYEGLLEKGEIYQDLLRKGLVSVVAEDE